MPPTKPQFRALNGDPALCSAWIKSENRCCQRQISASDRKLRDRLLSLYRNSRVPDIEAALIQLFFCKNWHRPGGKYSISEMAQSSILAYLQARAPSHPAQPQGTQAASGGTTTVAPAQTQQGSFQDVRGYRRSARLQQQIAAPAPVASLRPRSRQGDESTIPSEAAGQRQRTSDGIGGYGRSALGQERSDSVPASAPSTHEVPLQSGESSVAPTTVRRSPRRLPAQTFAQAPAGRADPRRHREVDVGEECAICRDELGLPRDVARCNGCSNDYHIACVAECFRTAEGRPKCPTW